MTGVYNLNNGVKIADLYKDLEEKQIEQIEKAADGGFSTDELKSLEKDGIDTSLIKQNSTQDTQEKETVKKTNADLTAKANEIKEKYCSNLANFDGDDYSAENPELQALNKAMDDGAITALAKEGFTKSQIADIVKIAFPSLGIESTSDDGSYTRPYGHGEEAQKIYDRFSSHLLASTGEDTEEIKAAKAKLTTINNQILSNNHSMQVLEATVSALQEEVQEQIEEAIEKSKDIQEDHKDKAKEALNKHLNAYTTSNGEMTYEQFQSGLAGELNGLESTTGRKLGDVVCSLVDANYKMSMLKGYVDELGTLAKDNEDLTVQAQDTKSEIDKLTQEAAEKASSSDPQATCTDPIGFTTETERYDFFIDSDSNGDITNENEFLGAKDGFSEVTKLDTDGDNVVSAQELEAGNVKVIKTNKDGTQEIVNASDVFKNATDGIKLNTYQEANQDLGEGNTLLGTFSASVNGQDMQGYQTLDSNEWLDKNYEFTDEVNGVGRFAQDGTGVAEAYDIGDKINIFTLKNEELTTKLDEAWKTWGFSDAEKEAVISAMDSQGSAKGKTIESKFEEIAQKEKELATQSEEEKKADKEKIEEMLKAEEEQEAQEAQEAQDAQEAEETEEEENNKKKKDEEEE